MEFQGDPTDMNSVHSRSNFTVTGGLRNFKIKTLAILPLVAFLASCGPDSSFNNQTAGTLGGGAVGAVIGSGIGGGSGKIVATAVGGVLGALLGGYVGKSLDDKDRELISYTTQNTLETAPSGSPVSWRNPDNGHYGNVTPVRTYEYNGQDCREFTQTVFIEGRPEKGRGTACRGADGVWDIQ